MKVAESWLREWVNPDVDSQTLAHQLTMAGLAVDAVEPVAPAFAGVVVAEVRTVDAHPDAAKLQVCTVFDGMEEQRVVCGAPNVTAGKRYPFARLGAALPGGLSIRKAKLRGVESHGMLCSEVELGLGDDASGLMELPDDLEVGLDLRRALALDDNVFEIDLTPNRGDCMGIRGVAREVAVCNAIPWQAVDCSAVAPKCKDTFPVRLDDPDGCPRYLGRVIRNVSPGAATPLWMQERLRRSGVRPIDAVVDITNYVMLELGQPMHAFDLNVLKDGIVVRRAGLNETLELLDGRTVELDADTLLITDADGPVAIAGVMGGERSGIQPDTKDVFLECAFFAPAGLFGTARRYGMQTDASQRFERGVDSQLQFAAMERATALLLDIVGGEPGPVVDTVSEAHLPRRHTVSLRHSRLNALVGMDVDAEEVVSILTRLDFSLLETTGNDTHRVWTFGVPSHRFDVEREVDLIEEVVRIHGFDAVPPRLPSTALELSAIPLDRTSRGRIRSMLVDLGYQELVTYSFIDRVLQDLLDPSARAIELTNPLSSEMAVMRTNLLPGLVSALRANEARQQTRVRLFEMGRCFVPNDDVPAQPVRIGGLIAGDRMPLNWSDAATEVDFFDVKGDVERVLAIGGRGPVTFAPLDDPVLHPGQAARVLIDEEVVGRIGRLHPELEARFELRRAAFVFELDVDAVLITERRRASAVSKFPSVRRDIAVLVDRAVPAAALEACVRRAVGGCLVDFRLFDVYHGEGIDSAKKSIALGLTFQDQTRTLTDTDINALVDTAVGALETDLGARLR